jgi:MFS family permease
MGITIASVGSAIFCIPMGMLVDRVGPRLIGLTGTLLMAGTYALLGTATGKIENWLMLWD